METLARALRFNRPTHPDPLLQSPVTWSLARQDQEDAAHVEQEKLRLLRPMRPTPTSLEKPRRPSPPRRRDEFGAQTALRTKKMVLRWTTPQMARKQMAMPDLPRLRWKPLAPNPGAIRP